MYPILSRAPNSVPLCFQMSEINRNLSELWQSTYKGTDIDYIAIRSDTEEDQQKTGAGIAGQRSYNYRYRKLK